MVWEQDYDHDVEAVNLAMIPLSAQQTVLMSKGSHMSRTSRKLPASGAASSTADTLGRRPVQLEAFSTVAMLAFSEPNRTCMHASHSA